MNLKKIAFCITLIASTAVGQAFAEETAENLFEASFILEARKDYAGSLNSILKIIRMDPKNYMANLRAAWLFHCRGDYSASCEYYQKASSIAPDAVEPLLGGILPLMTSRQWDRAEKAAIAALKTDRNSYLAGSRLAYILYAQGRFSDAARAYEKVLVLYPSDVDMKQGLGWSYLKMGQKSKAAAVFGEILAVYKNNSSAKTGIGLCK
ncbi:MAG: tetratricopeptide repeat protein [Spirochaetes bacterium]|jgi:tetratricopeptide (TPR) repeat protein|nr:tetratricopeptide repeat protein [Spirochaetota bacterium]